jgi:uncharacterized protein with HEPN domain
MKRNLIPYLKDILDNLELAAGFTAGMSYEEFSLDAKTGVRRDSLSGGNGRSR